MFRVRGCLVASLRFCTQAIFPHQAGNAILTARNILLFECLINARAPIGDPAIVMHFTNSLQQLSIRLAMLGFRLFTPGIVATAGKMYDLYD